MILTKNALSVSEIPVFNPKKENLEKSFQQTLEVISTNLQIPMTYRFQNLTYLVIFTKMFTFS